MRWRHDDSAVCAAAAAAGTISYLLLGFPAVSRFGKSNYCYYEKKSAADKMSCAGCFKTTQLCGNMYHPIMHCWMVTQT